MERNKEKQENGIYNHFKQSTNNQHTTKHSHLQDRKDGESEEIKDYLYISTSIECKPLIMNIGLPEYLYQRQIHVKFYHNPS